MDQLRNVAYKAPRHAFPWDPLRAELETSHDRDDHERTPTRLESPITENPVMETNEEMWQSKVSLEVIESRGHPAICKMLDFFEDREFYYSKWRDRSRVLVYLHMCRIELIFLLCQNSGDA